MLPSGIMCGFDFHFSKASVPIEPMYGGGVPAMTKLSNTRGSCANILTAATFRPAAYICLLSLSNWHSSSSTTTPVAKPSILVCMAPDVATLQISELLTTTLGALAVGGVEFVTTVEETVLVSAKTCVVINSNTNSAV